MDADSESSDDETIDFDCSTEDTSPFRSECKDEKSSIESFYQCFINRYDACPIFFAGALSEACQAAFDSEDIRQHRPILVYIHHERSRYNLFCKTIFCREFSVEYLLANYLVWPWDITLESNRNRLATIWKEAFNCSLLDEFSAEKCPMLFGITRRLPGRKIWSPSVQYRFTSLVKDDKLIRTQEIITQGSFGSELLTFKEECDRIEEALMFYDEKVKNDLRIELFDQRLEERHQYCPASFADSLQNACESTHNLALNKEHRPVLIYIHDNEGLRNGTMNSMSMTDDVSEDFIFYPFNISSKLNQEILSYMWNELFYESFPKRIPMENCSLLFGVMRLFNETKIDSISSKYQFKVLFDNNKLTHYGLPKELLVFKQESYANEKALACDFLQNTGFCWENILEISQYLTLNDIINSFSTEILPLLSELQVKVHLSDPSDAFVNMINGKLQPKQIASLQFSRDYFSTRENIHLWPQFSSVESLIFINPFDPFGFFEIRRHFPRWTNLLLWFDKKVVSNYFNMFEQLPSSVTRLEIRASVPVQLHCVEVVLNSTIKYFRFDFSRFAPDPSNDDMRSYISNLLSKFVKLISMFSNAQSVSFIIKEFIIENLLDKDEWKVLANNCPKLNKVTLVVVGNMSLNEELAETILQIQNTLRNIRDSIRFRVIFSKTI